MDFQRDALFSTAVVERDSIADAAVLWAPLLAAALPAADIRENVTRIPYLSVLTAAAASGITSAAAGATAAEHVIIGTRFLRRHHRQI